MEAPCGKDCNECATFLATINDDLAEKKRISERYLKDLNIKISPEEISCHGCEPDDKPLSPIARDCKIRKQYFIKYDID